jgi:hypothetical protein
MIYFGVLIARSIKKPGWKGGILVAIVMYLLMFWDLIPFHVAHKYYCSSEGGFTVYKTLEEWEIENPGVIEILVPMEKSVYVRNGNTERYVLNQRFAWEIVTTAHFLGIRKIDNRVIDIKNEQILAQYVDFNSNQHMREPKNFRDYKLWINKKSCDSETGNMDSIRFYKYEGKIELLGSDKIGQ